MFDLSTEHAQYPVSLQERHFSFGNNFAVTIPPMIHSTRNFLLLGLVEMHVSCIIGLSVCKVSHIKRLLGISAFQLFVVGSQKAYTLYLESRNSNVVR